MYIKRGGLFKGFHIDQDKKEREREREREKMKMDNEKKARRRREQVRSAQKSNREAKGQSVLEDFCLFENYAAAATSLGHKKQTNKQTNKNARLTATKNRNQDLKK